MTTGPFDDEFDSIGRDPISREEQQVDELNALKYRSLKNTTLIERDLSSYPQAEQTTALQRYKLISLIGKDNNKGWTPKVLTPLIDRHFKASGLSKRPSSKSVYRWHKAFVESGGDLKSLVNRHHDKGSSEPKVKGDEHYFELAVKRFLDTKRPSYQKAYEFYKDSIVLENESIIEGKIPYISYDAFKKRLQKLPPYMVAVGRYGQYYADLWYRYYEAHEPPTRVLQRVEIDHTPLDVILIDDELLVPLGRPYLTLLVDVFSGCIIGYHLGFKAPSYPSVSKAIIHSIKPKEYILNSGIPLLNNWDCCGKIENLVVDNGAEFWSHSLDKACLEAGIGVHYNKVRRPWLKPFVERSFGKINEMFLMTIPGKTFSNTLEKADYDPVNDAVVRFSVFCEEFLRWVVDVHNQKPDSRMNKIPALYWQRSIDTLKPLELSVEDEKQLSVVMGIADKRKLTSQGITYEYLQYDCRALSDYRKEYPQSRASKVLIKVDPDDLSSIYVFLHELGSYLEVPAKDAIGYTKNRSLEEHKVLISAHKKFIGTQVDIVGLAKARMALHERILEEQDNHQQKPRNKSKLKNTKKLAAYKGISSDTPGTISEQPIIQDNDIEAVDILTLWNQSVNKVLKQE